MTKGARLSKKAHYWYIKENLKTAIARTIKKHNNNIKIYLSKDESEIITHMNNPYFIINFTDELDDSHLHNACSEKNYLMVKKLLERGAIITPQAFVVCCPSWTDKHKDSIACATVILEKDPSLINTLPSPSDNTLLSESAHAGEKKMV